MVSKNIDQIGLSNYFKINSDYAIFDKAVPYIEKETKNKRGLVDIIEIIPDCDVCFPLTPVKSQFENMGIYVNNYKKISSNSSEGKSLVQKNNLDFAPALLTSNEIESYDWIFPEMKEYFIEKNEYFLFKEKIPPYVDLNSGRIKGIVNITFITDNSCEECFNVTELKKSFESYGVYFGNETTIDISSNKGKIIISRYNVTAVPTIMLSKEILDYNQLREVLKNVGTFDDTNQNFVFRSLDKLNFKYTNLKGGEINGN